MSLVDRFPENIKRRGFLKNMQWMPELDGLRGILCFLVILFHIRHSFVVDGVYLYEIIYKFLWNLWWVVDLFFSLSGFLITHILFNIKEKGEGFRSFYARRALRIFPLYYLTLFIFIYILPNYKFFGEWETIQFLQEKQMWYWGYLQNQLFINEGHSPLMTMFAHFWTLAIEEQFYFLWPIVFYFTPKERIRLVTLFIILISFIFRVYIVYDGGSLLAMNTYTISKLDSIMVGALLACEIRYGNYLITFKRTIAFVALFIVLQLIYFSVKGPFWYGVSASSGLTMIAYGVYLFMRFLFNKESLLNKILRNNIIVSFGHYGYGIYVIHMPIVKIFGKLKVFDHMRSILHEPLITFILYLLLVLLVSYIGGFLTWTFFEKKVLKLKKYFPY